MKLSEIVTIKPGYPFRSAIKDTPEGGSRVVRMGDIDDQASIAWDTVIKSRLTGKRKPDYLQPDDVLFLMRGRRNIAVHIQEVPGPAVIAPHFFLLRLKSNSPLIPGFLAWQINQRPVQKYFEVAAEGTLQRNIRRTELEALSLVTPDLETQHMILRLEETVCAETKVYEALINNRRQLMQGIAEKFLTGKIKLEH